MLDKEKTVRLLARARTGDKRAHKEIYRRYARRLHAYFHRRGLQRDVEDAAQETFVRMLAALSEDTVQLSTFEGWLFTTARNVGVDMIRARVRDRDALRAVREESAASDQDELEESERRLLLRNAVRALPEPLRQVFALRYERGLSYRAIASELGISSNAVGIRLYRARKILWGCLRGRI